MKKLENFAQYGVEDLTSVQLSSIRGGGILSDTIGFLGECVGTVIGGVICGLKCISNHLGATEPKK